MFNSLLKWTFCDLEYILLKNDLEFSLNINLILNHCLIKCILNMKTHCNGAVCEQLIVKNIADFTYFVQRDLQHF